MCSLRLAVQLLTSRHPRQEPLEYRADRQELFVASIGVVYPIINGVAHLIPADARIENS